MAMPNAGDGTPVHTMKRTGLSAWTAGRPSMLRKSIVNTTHTTSEDGTLPRVVSGGAAETTSGTLLVSLTPDAAPIMSQAVKKGLASSSLIKAAQQQWEKNKKLAEKHGGSNSPSSASGDLAGNASQGRTAGGQPAGNASNLSKQQQTRADQGVVTPVPLPRYPMYQPPSESGAAVVRTVTEPRHQELTEETVMKQMETVAGTGSKTKRKTKKSVGGLNDPVSLPRPFKTPAMLVEAVRKEAQRSKMAPEYLYEGGGRNRSQTYLVVSDLVEPSPRARPPASDMPPVLYEDREGKSYYAHKDSSGAIMNTKGAPFPPGNIYYGGDDSKKTFICPMRDCRVLSSNIKTIASHFHGRHSGLFLNDNGDGTFSKIGTYSNKDGSSPGIIITQDPLEEGAEEPAVPMWTTTDTASRRASAKLEAQKQQKRRLSSDDIDDSGVEDISVKKPRVTAVAVSATPSSVTSGKPSNGGLEAQPSIKYLHGLLSPAQVIFDERSDVLELAVLERRRELPTAWVNYHKNRTLDVTNYSCALAYIVGDEIKGAKACTRWQGPSRLSNICVTLPDGLSPSATMAFTRRDSCVGCRYYSYNCRQKLDCAFLTGNPSPSNIPASQVDVSESESFSKASTFEDDGTSSSVVDQESEADIEQGGDVEVTSHEPESDVRSVAEQRRSPQALTRPQSQPRGQNQQTRRLRDANTLVTEALPPVVNHFSAADLEMEDWEFAPGTIRDPENNENIGFSNALMTSGNPIIVSPDVGFNIVVLKPGDRHRLPSESNKIRTCSIGSGKVRVRMTSGQMFKLGTNGLFVLRPGQSCIVENRLYIDAVIHCTTIQDYELR